MVLLQQVRSSLLDADAKHSRGHGYHLLFYPQSFQCLWSASNLPPFSYISLTLFLSHTFCDSKCQFVIISSNLFSLINDDEAYPITKKNTDYFKYMIRKWGTHQVHHTALSQKELGLLNITILTVLKKKEEAEFSGGKSGMDMDCWGFDEKS
jgi:hypothetical protein